MLRDSAFIESQCTLWNAHPVGIYMSEATNNHCMHNCSLCLSCIAVQGTRVQQTLSAKLSNICCLQSSEASAICLLEPGVHQMVDSGVHPLHSSCLDIYTCLSSAWRLQSRGCREQPQLAAPAHARSALYTLLLSHGLRELLKTGWAFCRLHV